MRQVSLQQVAFAGLALALAAVVGLVALTWSFTQQTLRATAFVSHTQEVMSALGAAEAQLFRAEASQRTYLADLAPDLARQRDRAVGELLRRIDEVTALTLDNAAQQRRLAELKPLIERRLAEYRQLQQRLQEGQAMSPKDALLEGMDMRAALSPMFEAMAADERRLLDERQAEENRRIEAAKLTFGALVLALALLLSAVFWRLRGDLAARREAEAVADEERRYDAAHARALTLYNATSDREEALNGTLALLADSAVFPVSAFYAHEEIGGLLRLVASRGAPSDIRLTLRIDDGVIGSAARGGVPVYLETFDPHEGLRIETGLASARPAAMLFTPVMHQGKLLGVLALALAARLRERDRVFVDRLCAQLGVALHNLGQLEGLSQLADQLRDSAEEIHRKNEQLERASRMKSEFVANMSHELRTPLNAVIGFSEVLRDGLAGDLNAEQREYVGDINDSGKHLLSLINDILDLSKVEAGQMTLELGSLLPIELAASGIAIVRDKAAQRRVVVGESVAPGLDAVLVDPRRAKQIVYNLLSNAVKFTPDGGRVMLSLRKVAHSHVDAMRSTDDTRVFAVRDPSHAAWLEIEVADAGIGISPAGLRELFQPFAQIDSSLSRRFEGTGLGLTMVQRLTELHGGGLMVHSVPGRGSTFTVWLPWRDASAEEGAAPSRSAAAAEGGPAPLILLIEDDARAANLIQLQLREQGFRIEVARNAESGLQRAIELRPAAIVLDVILPGMDGWDMLSKLKEQEQTRHIPVVIVSITDEPRLGFALGAAQVLVKPVSTDELLAALAAAGLQPYNGGGRVLVVDDDPKAVGLVCKQLEAAGFTPVGAYGGSQALELVADQRPDLIVLDLMMPHVTGFDVLEALGRRPETADLPIVVLTAKLVTPQDREQLRGRVQRIMEKSEFHSSGLLAEVRRAMVRRRRHDH